MPGFISLADAKAQLVVENDTSDELIQRLINAAGAHIERQVGYVAEQREEIFAFDRFTRQLELRLRPVDPDSIAVTYLDSNGDEQTFTDFRVTVKNGTTRIVPAIGFCWPRSACTPGAVTVTATVGFADSEAEAADDAPETLRHATRVCVCSWFQDREAGPIPEAVCLLLDDERARRA
jgi:uncharacterized phiE125 gp8 family phage protein